MTTISLLGTNTRNHPVDPDNRMTLISDTVIQFTITAVQLKKIMPNGVNALKKIENSKNNNVIN